MICEFLISQFLNIQDALINHEVKNTRTIHVYEKFGFQIVSKFTAKWHLVTHETMHLDMNGIV